MKDKHKPGQRCILDPENMDDKGVNWDLTISVCTDPHAKTQSFVFMPVKMR